MGACKSKDKNKSKENVAIVSSQPKPSITTERIVESIPKVAPKSSVDQQVSVGNEYPKIAKEQELIKKLGRRDLNEGPLCNMTDGGDGIWNCIRSEDVRKKLSEGKKGEKNPQYGKKPSIESLLKRANSLRGQKRSDETKKRQSESSIKSGQAKEVDVFKFGTNEYVGRFYAISEACRVLGFHHLNSKAILVANGKRRQTQGYVFRYVN